MINAGYKQEYECTMKRNVNIVNHANDAGDINNEDEDNDGECNNEDLGLR